MSPEAYAVVDDNLFAVYSYDLLPLSVFAQRPNADDNLLVLSGLVLSGLPRLVVCTLLYAEHVLLPYLAPPVALNSPTWFGTLSSDAPGRAPVRVLALVLVPPPYNGLCPLRSRSQWLGQRQRTRSARTGPRPRARPQSASGRQRCPARQNERGRGHGAHPRRHAHHPCARGPTIWNA
jgi:hypothetical protein